MAQATRGYHAELDAIEIWVHVARHDAAAADRLTDRFTATINLLATQPRLGRAVTICCRACAHFLWAIT